MRKGSSCFALIQFNDGDLQTQKFTLVFITIILFLINLYSSSFGTIIEDLLVSVFGGIIFGRNHQTSTLPRPPVNSLHNVHQLLFVLHGPVYLVVISRPKIDHDVFVSEEEHGGAGVVQLVHLIEIRNLQRKNTEN